METSTEVGPVRRSDDPSEPSERGTVRCWREWEFWALAALMAATYFSRIGDLPIRGEETRRAMVAAEILQTGDWIVPRQQGRPFLSRPPVGSWPIAWLAAATGDLSLASVRLPTVLATLLTALLVYAYSRRFLSRLGALSSGLAFGTFAQVLQLGRVAETEATFTLFLSAALLLWHWGYTCRWPAAWTWCLPYALLAIATLVKSLQAPVYFAGAVGLYLLWRRDWRFLISRAHLFGILIFAAVFAAWQAPFYSQLGWSAVREVWASDVGLRFAELSPAIVVGHLAAYPFEVLACLLPWSLLLPAYLWPQFRRTIGATWPMVAFLAIAWLVALPTCWFVPNARPRYIMPLYPLAAPLVGLVVQRVFEADAAAIMRIGWRWFVAGSGAAMLGAAAVVALASWFCGVAIPELAQPPWFAALYTIMAITAVTMIARYWGAWSPRSATITVLVLAAFAAITSSGVAVNSLVALSPSTAEQIAHIKERLPKRKSLHSFGEVQTLFSYHWREPIKLATKRLPKTARDVPRRLDYFCFNWTGDDPPQLPFPWRIEAIVNCDRVEESQPRSTVIVGRRVEAVTLLPDDAPIRR